MSKPVVKVGLKFSSSHFSAEGEIVAVREAENKCDIMFTPSDLHSWVDKDWNLKLVKDRFETGEFKEVKPNTVNISII